MSAAGPPVSSKKVLDTLVAHGWQAELRDDYLLIDLSPDSPPDYTLGFEIQDTVPFSFVEKLAESFDIPIEAFYDSQ